MRGPDGWVTLRYVITSGTASLSFQPVSFPDVGGDQGSSGGSLSLADFNGDGLADVWHARGDDKQVVVWINAGGGLFYARTVDRPRPAFDADPRYQYRRTAVLDYNADGRSDLLENWQFVEDFGGELFSHNSNTALLPDSILSLFAAEDARELKHPSIGAGVVPSSFDVSADIDGDGNRDIFGDGENCSTAAALETPYSSTSSTGSATRSTSHTAAMARRARVRAAPTDTTRAWRIGPRSVYPSSAG